MDTVLWSLGSGQLVLLRKKKNMWAGITDVPFELVQEEKHAFPQHRSGGSSRWVKAGRRADVS